MAYFANDTVCFQRIPEKASDTLKSNDTHLLKTVSPPPLFDKTMENRANPGRSPGFVVPEIGSNSGA